MQTNYLISGNEFWYEVIQLNWEQGCADAVQFMSLMRFVTFVPKCAESLAAVG